LEVNALRLAGQVGEFLGAECGAVDGSFALRASVRMTQVRWALVESAACSAMMAVISRLTWRWPSRSSDPGGDDQHKHVVR
jgi:hypothetical protein